MAAAQAMAAAIIVFFIFQSPGFRALHRAVSVHVMDHSGEKFPQQPVSRFGNRKMPAGAQAVRHRYDRAVKIDLTIVSFRSSCGAQDISHRPFCRRPVRVLDQPVANWTFMSQGNS
jgi:hypothetical protein